MTDKVPKLPECKRVGLHNCSGQWKNHDHADDQPWPFIGETNKKG